nr:RNA-directed DNA polymerase, eukaryota [Tanacetum cinerariifolium]
LFPRLFVLELNKEVTVADKVKGVVSISFRHPERAGSEYQHLTDLNSLTESVLLSHSCDRWICDLSGDGEFRVKEVRNFLDNLFLPSYADATRWVKYIPIKINVFVWRARRDFLPTRVNLSRRGILLESSSCPLCLSMEENIHQVLFGCGLAESIFRRICRWWELDWQALESFSDWNYWFSLICLSSKVKALLEGVFAGLVAGQCLGRRNTTVSAWGDYLIGLRVLRTTTTGLAATGSIIAAEVINDCMSPQCTNSSEDETGPSNTYGTRSSSSKSLTK